VGTHRAWSALQRTAPGGLRAWTGPVKWIPPSTVVAQQKLTDPFDTLDLGRWVKRPSIGGLSHVVHVPGKLRLILDAKNKRGLEAVCYGGFYLSGDFDFQVDYSLPVWPSGDHYAKILVHGLGTTASCSIRRETRPGGDAYRTVFGRSVRTVPTKDLSGALRLVRKGSTYYGYYRTSSGWSLIASASGGLPSSVVRVQLGLLTQVENLAAVTVDFDNFAATAATITPILSGSGAPRPGAVVRLDLAPLSEITKPYFLGASFGLGPIPIIYYGIAIWELALSPDPLLWVSLSGSLPTIFRDFAGTTDKQGKATASIQIPAEPALIGLTIHTAFATYSGQQFTVVSNTYSFTITK